MPQLSRRRSGFKHLLILPALGGLVLLLSGCQEGAGGMGGQARGLVGVRETGDRYYVTKDYQQALDNYQEYVDRAPGNPYVHAQMGRTYMALGQFPAACEQLRIAHSVDRRSDEITESLCEALLGAGQQEELYRLTRQIAEENQGVQDYFRLARFSMKMNDADEARRALLTAAKLDGGKTVRPQLALAEFYASVGDERNAVQRLRMAYFIEPGNARTNELIRTFGQVPGPTFGVPPQER
ncbi:MAG: hypothetical protein JNM07_08870 [Phycisphaerae bacterium]|nr:hypothetical protein [Phycisphaerae bacterium]